MGLTLTDGEINAWLDVDFEDKGYGLLTDEEIINFVKHQNDLRQDTSLGKYFNNFLYFRRLEFLMQNNSGFFFYSQ